MLALPPLGQPVITLENDVEGRRHGFRRGGQAEQGSLENDAPLLQNAEHGVERHEDVPLPELFPDLPGGLSVVEDVDFDEMESGNWGAVGDGDDDGAFREGFCRW